MKQIYWNKLSSLEKIVFILGWLGVLNIIFWIAMVIIYSYTNNKYKKFFNPETFKVVYVFGWIWLVIIILVILVLILMLAILFSADIIRN